MSEPNVANITYLMRAVGRALHGERALVTKAEYDETIRVAESLARQGVLAPEAIMLRDEMPILAAVRLPADPRYAPKLDRDTLVRALEAIAKGEGA